MRTQLEVFQRLDSRFRGNDKQGGNGEGDAFPWSPYPKLGLAASVGASLRCLPGRMAMHQVTLGTSE